VLSEVSTKPSNTKKTDTQSPSKQVHGNEILVQSAKLHDTVNHDRQARIAERIEAIENQNQTMKLMEQTRQSGRLKANSLVL